MTVSAQRELFLADPIADHSVDTRLATIVESSHDAIFSKTLDGSITTWNRGAERMYGYTADEIVGRSVSVLVPPDRDDEHFHILARASRGERVEALDTQREAKDGRRLHVSLTVSPLFDDEGCVIGFSVIARDNTAHRRIQREAKRRARELRKLLTCAPIGIHRTSRDGRILWANRAELELLGYPRSEYIGRRMAEFYADPRIAHEITDCVRRRETVSNREADLRCKDGSIRHVLVSANRLSHGKDGAWDIRCFTVDVTPRRRAEQRLKESEERFRAVADRLPIAIWLARADGAFTFVNKIWTEFRGNTSSDDLNHEWRAAVHPDDRGQCVSAFDAAVRTRSAFEIEHRLRRYDGRYRWVRNHGIPRLSPDGAFIGYIGSCVDITEQKETEVYLQERARQRADLLRREHRQRRAAEQRNREQLTQLAHFARVATMGEMASGLAHELNQPLCAIVNYTEACLTMLSARGGDRDVRGHLARVAEQAERAGEVIRRLRDFIRRRAPVKQPVDINHIVQETIRLARCDLAEARAHVSLSLLPDPPTVTADMIQIQQVLLNLLRNALDAMRDVPPHERQLRLETNRQGDRFIEVAVRDNGVGVPDGEDARLFEPFFSTKAQGMGMGLSISRSILEAHDGRIWFTRNADRGLTLRFTLPLAQGVNHGMQNANGFCRG